MRVVGLGGRVLIAVCEEGGGCLWWICVAECLEGECWLHVGSVSGCRGLGGDGCGKGVDDDQDGFQWMGDSGSS